jgi:hypothetical protein
MPIPEPQPQEAKDEFIARCLRDSVMTKEYPDTRQRAAICYQQSKK